MSRDKLYPDQVTDMRDFGRNSRWNFGDPRLDHQSTHTMSCAASRRCLTQLLRDPVRSTSLPTFLVPAFSQPLRAQWFSTTSLTHSRVGATPITVPPEVTLKFIDLPQPKSRGRAKEIPKMAVEVNGPLGMLRSFLVFLMPTCLSDTGPIALGQLTLKVPPFVTIKHDETLRKATLSVEDPTIAHQRAMWGASNSVTLPLSVWDHNLTAFTSKQEQPGHTCRTTSSAFRKAISVF